METEGMERCLNYLRAQDMSVDTLVTDRHSEGKAALRRNHPDIRHHFDVWHVAKGTMLVLQSLSAADRWLVMLSVIPGLEMLLFFLFLILSFVVPGSPKNLLIDS